MCHLISFPSLVSCLIGFNCSGAAICELRLFQDISQNHLTHLPPDVGSLVRLMKLNIAGNQLQVLPPEIGNLRGSKTSVAAPPHLSIHRSLPRIILFGSVYLLALSFIALSYSVWILALSSIALSYSV